MLWFLRERNLKGTLEGFATAPFFFLLLFAYLPLGFALSLVNFTYGAQGHEPAVRAMLPQMIFSSVAMAYSTEILFRGIILRFLLGRFLWEKALWIHLALVNLALAPFLWPKGWRMEGMGFFPFLLWENLLEGFWALYFLRTGSLIATAFLHGLYNFGRFTVMNDVSGPFETLYFYSAASDDFYWLALAVTFAGLGIQVLILRRWGFREGRKDA